MSSVDNSQLTQKNEDEDVENTEVIADPDRMCSASAPDLDFEAGVDFGGQGSRNNALDPPGSQPIENAQAFCPSENVELNVNSSGEEFDDNKVASQEETQFDVENDSRISDPDVTFFDETGMGDKPPVPLKLSSRQESKDTINIEEEIEYLNRTQSQESTLPISQESTLPISQESMLPTSQEMEHIAPADTASQLTHCRNKLADEILEIVASQDFPEISSLEGENEQFERSKSKSPTLETGKLNNLNHSDEAQDTGSSSLQATSSSMSSSYVSSRLTTTSSSKRATESEDSEGILGLSQDMFASQSSQKNTLSVSQLVPALQLSGDVSVPQGSEDFFPGRIYPSSPSIDIESNANRITSTPVRYMKKLPSDEVMCIEASQKLGEKRKHSDSSLESQMEGTSNIQQTKKRCPEDRKSVVVLEEINQKQASVQQSQEDFTQDSQGFFLHLSQTDQGGFSSDVLEISDSKSVKPNTSAEQDASIVIEEDDEVQVVTPPSNKQAVLGEITLDTSEPRDEIQVLSSASPYKASLKSAGGNSQNNSGLPFHQRLEKTNSSPYQLARVNHSTPQAQLQEKNSKKIALELESSKENIQPCGQDNNEVYENDFIVTCTFTMKVSCKTTIDMQTMEVKDNCISEIKTNTNTHVMRDRSSSPIEETSSGVGAVSPGSTASGPGPFALPTTTHLARMANRFSTTSSSSAGSFVYQSYHKRARPALSYRSCGAQSQPSEHHVQRLPSHHEGPTPWEDLFTEKTSAYFQNELASAGAEKFTVACNQWVSNIIHSSSSDENKTTIMDSGSGSCLKADNEVVLGVPSVQDRTLKMKVVSSPGSAVPSEIQESHSEVKNTVKSETESKSTPSTRKGKQGRIAKRETPTTPRGSARKREKRNVTVKLREAVVEQVTATDDSTLNFNADYFVPGAQVFALWGDHFYPAELISCTKLNQWNVIFHDKKKSVLSKNKILLINAFEIEQSVSAFTPNKEYEIGTITSVTPFEEKDDLYTIKLSVSGKTITVPKSDMCLSKDQALPYLREQSVTLSSTSSTPSKCASASKICSSAVIDLDNVVQGKRNRTPKGNQGDSAFSSPNRPGPSNTSRRLISDSCSASATEDEALATALIAGVQPEQTGWSSIADPLARKGKGTKRGSKQSLPDDIEDEETLQKLGPIPKKGSKIFAGYFFFITFTDVLPRRRPPSPRKDGDLQSSDIDSEAQDGGSQHASDSECFVFTRLPMYKGRLNRQIIQGGGKVLSHWTHISVKQLDKTYVVTNRPCLTAVYIHCLARGVKSVPHELIITCCKENEKFGVAVSSNCLLPAGYSYLRKRFVEWSEHKPKVSLKNETILVTGDRNFKSFWKEVLNLSGANVATTEEFLGGLKRVTKILSENPCTEPLLERASDLNIPIVSPAWLTQSLINNQSLDYDSLASFAYDYSESE